MFVSSSIYHDFSANIIADYRLATVSHSLLELLIIILHLPHRIAVQEGLFVGMTSSIVALVQDFNRYFCCPSNNRACKGKCSIFFVFVLISRCLLARNVVHDIEGK